MLSLQERYAPSNHCFGCGPANERGLHIGSFPSGGPDSELIATFRPLPHHEAFDGVVNGGIIGTLLDCHSNWTAAYHLMVTRGLDAPPCTVTSDFHITLKRPTPSDRELHLRARAVETIGDRVVVEAVIEAEGKVTATCRGTFVAVGEGHPAYFRW
jgi:acyl-coenzyme A thioesterase PaaI-like protein